MPGVVLAGGWLVCWLVSWVAVAAGWCLMGCAGGFAAGGLGIVVQVFLGWLGVVVFLRQLLIVITGGWIYTWVAASGLEALLGASWVAVVRLVALHCVEVSAGYRPY